MIEQVCSLKTQETEAGEFWIGGLSQQWTKENKTSLQRARKDCGLDKKVAIVNILGEQRV